MDPVVVTTQTVVTTTCFSLTGKDIIDLLRARGHTVPDDANVSFTIPGGGDWSNTELQISAEYPVEVSFSSTITEKH